MGDAAADGQPVVRLECHTAALTGQAPGPSGVVWKLTEPGRQLDANLVRLAPGEKIGTHMEPDLDVLVHVVSGEGVMGTSDGPQQLSEGAVLWLPHGSSRDIAAGHQGLAYLTVHRRRPGMQIRRRTDAPPAGG
ncbi:cupin domain-containing protein [Streptomyces orinoci]|uniref:Cupin 2 conserved barrel domain-containing protein n=1 Tax=Streptomyces orinoci TaxID=67339 RepID=A0ABV3K0T1_STRON|nr:hypothetical protein [Streptomyces orinoci]